MPHVLLVLPLTSLPDSSKTACLLAIFNKLRATHKFRSSDSTVVEISEHPTRRKQLVASVSLLSSDVSHSIDTAKRIAASNLIDSRHVVLVDKHHSVASTRKTREVFSLPNLHVQLTLLSHAKCAVDFERCFNRWTRPSRMPRYFSIDLTAHQDAFNRVLQQTRFVPTDWTRLTVVADPHVTLLYTSGTQPADWVTRCKVEDLQMLRGRKMRVEIKSAVYIENHLLCFNVAIVGMDKSLFPTHPHVTVCYSQPLKARNSNDLLKLAQAVDFTHFHGDTGAGSLHSATGHFVMEDFQFERLWMWRSRKNLQLNGPVTLVY